MKEKNISRPGRPKSENKRRSTSVALTEDARARITAFAEKNGLSISEAMNRLILENL